ncbi:MAG: zinc ribbon domain-containing protein [Paenisporosarcina sp.]
MKPYNNCQSCGMPFSKDPQGGGTEANGDISVLYCSHCYQNGMFTLPDLTMNDMKDLVKGKLMEFGIPKIFTGLFTRNINKLERWKK